jgi:hypothetical protein
VYCSNSQKRNYLQGLQHHLEMALNNTTLHLGRIIESTPAVDLELAKAFAAKSHHLEHLSISYMIEAQQFFTSCQQLQCTWNLLQSLTLTSSTLARTVPHQHIYTLLRKASSIALKIPQLKPWCSGTVSRDTDVRYFISNILQLQRLHLHGVVHGFLSSVTMLLSPRRRLPLVPATYGWRRKHYATCISGPMSMQFIICACRMELLIQHHSVRYVTRE